MKIKIAGIPVEVVSNETIWEDGCPVIAVPMAKMLPMVNYAEGTKAGFLCSLCSQDCILAPSGQQVVATDKNPIVCMDCFIKISAQEKQGEN